MNEYFRELRNLSKKIDGDIQKLTKTWQTPHLLIGGYGINFDEASPCVESFFSTLKEVQDQLIEDRESRAKYISKTKEYLAGVDIFYQNLKEQCQEVETLLSTYGYEPLPNSSPTYLAIDESDTESKSIISEEMQNNDISPSSSTCLSLDRKETFVTFRIDEPKSIATPVIKSLASLKPKTQMNSNETKLCQGKDVFERMNYLYQASRFVASSSKIAASYYGNILTSCAKKSVLRMEPEVKRTICKNCQSPLIPGETARVRLISKPIKSIKWTCLACKTTRKTPLRRRNKLWIDDPDSVIQVFDYTPKIEIPTTEDPPENHQTNHNVQGKKDENSTTPAGSKS